MQAAHATFECGKTFPRSPTIDSLIVIGVPDEESLLATHRYVMQHGIGAVLFREPDLNDQATALCTEAIEPARKRLFRRYKLWKEDLVCQQSS